MKSESGVLLVIAAFFAVVAVVYWMWSGEQGGTVMLTGTSLLGLLPGSYYYWWSRRMKPRPEDDPHATREDGAGAVGAFPSSSIWPFTFGLGAFAIALALVFGIWSAIVGFVVVAIAVLGIIRESRRGGVI